MGVDGGRMRLRLMPMMRRVGAGVVKETSVRGGKGTTNQYGSTRGSMSRLRGGDLTPTVIDAGGSARCLSRDLSLRQLLGCIWKEVGGVEEQRVGYDVGQGRIGCRPGSRRNSMKMKAGRRQCRRIEEMNTVSGWVLARVRDMCGY
jgi:hypothetical protein